MGTAVETASAEVESASGKPVIIQPDASLKLIAKIALARGDAPAHVVSFNPAYGEATDYHIVFQCGFALRIYQTPIPERFDVGSTEVGRREASGLIIDHLRHAGRNLPEHVRNQLCGQLYDGLVLQLRSIPIGFRVDAWVRHTFPSLAEQQKRSATRQLNEYQAALAPQVKAIAPEKIYRGSMGMNAAFALFWARELGEPSVTFPYKAAGLLAVGESLLAKADTIPREPSSDRELIRSWGELLGISEWFAFVPFGG